MLLWELVCREPSTSKVLNEMLSAHGADQDFGAALNAFRGLWKESDPGSWSRRVIFHIKVVDDHEARELIYMFLFDVASAGTLNPAGQALLEDLRVAWSMPDILHCGGRGKSAGKMSAEEDEALMEELLATVKPG